MKKIIILGTAIALFGSMGAVQAAGDAAAGKAKSAVCAGCHGADGNSMVPTFPKLAGQHAAYLEAAMKEYKSGARSNPIMKGQAAGLSDADIANLAAYLASQTAK